MDYNINWFPGHMAKTKKDLTEKIKLVDLVIELRDARIPFSSANPLLNDIIKNQARLIILCKSDMAYPSETLKFIEYFKSNNILALDVDLISGYQVNLIKNYIKLASKNILDKRKSKGIINKEIRIMVVGIPNVGKSTFINKLTNRSSLNVGNKPGITKSSNVWIKLSNEFQLLDTPGILWPKLEDKDSAAKLALCGSIKDEVLPLEALAYYGIAYLKENYASNLKERYNLTKIEDVEEIINEIGSNRGCLKKGGIIDLDKTYKLILQDIKNSKLGKISYDKI